MGHVGRRQFPILATDSIGHSAPQSLLVRSDEVIA